MCLKERINFNKKCHSGFISVTLQMFSLLSNIPGLLLVIVFKILYFKTGVCVKRTLHSWLEPSSIMRRRICAQRESHIWIFNTIHVKQNVPISADPIYKDLSNLCDQSTPRRLSNPPKKTSEF
jgi:hypothetical protein